MILTKEAEHQYINTILNDCEMKLLKLQRDIEKSEVEIQDMLLIAVDNIAQVQSLLYQKEKQNG